MKVSTPPQLTTPLADTSAPPATVANAAAASLPATAKTPTLRSSFQTGQAKSNPPARASNEAQLEGDPSLFGLPLAGFKEKKDGHTGGNGPGWVDHDSQHPETAQAAATSAVKGGRVDGEYVMCPVIGSLIAEGSLKKAPDGNIDLKQLDDLMVHRLGITPERAAVTVGTGPIGQHASDLLHVLNGKFNVNHLHGSLLDHQGQGDTGIIRGGQFHEDKFQALCAHSKDGKTLTAADFAEAIKAQLKREDSVATRTKGASEDVFEMAALINTFGHVDKDGVRRIDISTLRDLYQNRKLPSAAALTSRAPTGVADHVATMAKIGADIPGAKSDPTAPGQPAGAKAIGMCPFMGRMLKAQENN